MPLSNEYREQLQDAFDLDRGGCLRAIAQKAVAVDAPVLIIGLGGTGVDSLLVTKKLIHDAIACEKLADGTYSDKPRNIEYLGIDTTYNDTLYRGMRLRRENHELMTFTCGDVSAILHRMHLQPPYIRNWLNPKIKMTALINGAGAVRQLGRLMLMPHILELEVVLRDKIQKVISGYPSTVPLYVFYLSNISGGTGGGMFLDMPYFVRAIAREEAPGRVISNIGMLFMADVTDSRAGVSAAHRQILHANAFAALKELDYLMDTEHLYGWRHGKMDQSYRSVTATPPDSYPEPPYIQCLLLSGKDRDGAPIGAGEKIYQEAVAAAAEMVFNFTLGEGDRNFDWNPIGDFCSRAMTNCCDYKMSLDNYHRRPVNYEYTIAGAAAAHLPIDEFMSYLAYEAFEQMEPYWLQKPEWEDVLEVLQDLRLTRKQMERAVRKGLLCADVDGVKYSDIKSNPAQVRQIYDAAEKKQEEGIRRNISDMTGALTAWIENSENRLNQFFRDNQRGPVFAQQCLVGDSPAAICVLNAIRNIADELSRETEKPEEMETLEGSAEAALQKIVNSRNILRIVDKANRDAYIDAMNKLYGARQRNFVNELLIRYCANAVELLTKENDRIYEPAAELMGTLTPLFQKFGAFGTDLNCAETAGGGKVSQVLMDAPFFIAEMKKRMAEKPESAADETRAVDGRNAADKMNAVDRAKAADGRHAIDRAEVIADFYQYLFFSEKLWDSKKKVDLAEEINKFFYREFRNILDHSMDFFLEIAAESQGQTMDQYCGQILNQLSQRAKVQFPVDSGADAEAPRPVILSASLPEKSPGLFTAARDASLRALKRGPYSTIIAMHGPLQEIISINFENAVPLCAYAALPELYRDYMRFRDEPGRHLYEPNDYSSVDWRQLPSPYPESEWKDGFTDEAEHQRNAVYREVLRKALEYGYVTTCPYEASMTLRWGAPVDYKSVLAEYQIDLEATTAIPDATVKNVRRKIASQLCYDGLGERLTESFTRSEMTTNDEKTKLKQDYMEMSFIQLFTLRDKIKEMVENHEACLAVLQKVKDRALDHTLVSHFVECRMYGLIRVGRQKEEPEQEQAQAQEQEQEQEQAQEQEQEQEIHCAQSEGEARWSAEEAERKTEEPEGEREEPEEKTEESKGKPEESEGESGNEYVYMDQSGEAQVLAELTPRQAAYSEHYLLEAYKHLPLKVRETLDRRADDLVKSTNEAESQSRLSDYSAKRVAGKPEELQAHWQDTDNGEALLTAYHQLRNAVCDLEPLFEDADEEF